MTSPDLSIPENYETEENENENENENEANHTRMRMVQLAEAGDISKRKVY